MNYKQLITNTLLDIQLESYALIAKGYMITYFPKIAGAIILYIIGSWLIKRVSFLLKKILLNKDYDASLQTFLVSLVKVCLTILLLVTVAGVLGADTTAFSALIVGAGVAIGSALNGTLGNFAGGVMMLVFKPFKIGDLIEAQGVTGVVSEQGVFSTTVLTPENKTVYIPNGPLSTNTIVNYTTHGNLRVDITMAIALDANVEKAKKVALDTINNHSKVLKTPAASVFLESVKDGMAVLAIRPYCAQPDYWDVFYGCTEAIKNAFAENAIAGPVPHRIIISK